MRAFLSHSSKDKEFVDIVSEHLRPGTYEMDSMTFDAGILNSEAISRALARCDLFCLFLSKSSVSSSYVDFEILLGTEFLARGSISRFIGICLDEEAFALARDSVKFYNIIRKAPEPEAAARLIQGQLISASIKSNKFNHPFVGRGQELNTLYDEASDHQKPSVKGLYFSGNAGTGRRSLALKFYENYLPHVGRIFPSIRVSEYCIEIYSRNCDLLCLRANCVVAYRASTRRVLSRKLKLSLNY